MFSRELMASVTHSTLQNEILYKWQVSLDSA